MANNIVEPCCCERQLPQLLREAKGGAALFQTSGDVTVEKMMRSVGCMVDNGSDLWLMLPSVDVDLLRLIRYWFQRGWINHLHLLTKEKQMEMVATELEGVAFEYATDKMVTDGFLAFTCNGQAVVLQGQMVLKPAGAASLLMYAGVFGREDSDAVQSVLDTMQSRLHIAMRKQAKVQAKEQTTEKETGQASKDATNKASKRPKKQASEETSEQTTTLELQPTDKAGDKPDGTVVDGITGDVAGEVGEPGLAADLGVDGGEL